MGFDQSFGSYGCQKIIHGDCRGQASGCLEEEGQSLPFPYYFETTAVRPEPINELCPRILNERRLQFRDLSSCLGLSLQKIIIITLLMVEVLPQPVSPLTFFASLKANKQSERKEPNFNASKTR